MYAQQILYAGMLSKSKGQILRVAATLHVLFHIDTPLAIPPVIGENAVKAAIDFVDVVDACIQQVSLLLSGYYNYSLWPMREYLQVFLRL